MKKVIKNVIKNDVKNYAKNDVKKNIDTHVLICRIPHLENFSGNDKNVLLAQIKKCKQIRYIDLTVYVGYDILSLGFEVTQEEKIKMYFRKKIDLIVL